MLHPDGSDPLAALRAAVARIEDGGLRQRRHARPADRVRLGARRLRLDAMLGGGLRRGSLHEIVAVQRQDDGAAAGFSTSLAACCARPQHGETAPLVWIVEDGAAREVGTPYRPGLAAHGIDPGRLVLVRTRDAPMTLWACEEALRLGAPVVLAELWGARHYGLVASRRLLLAARAAQGTALLLHTGLSGRADSLSSAAETRFSVAACPSPALAPAGGRLAIPGSAAFAVRLLKQRLGAVPGFDTETVHNLVWIPTQRCFDDHPVPFGLSAPLADRPAHAAQARTRHGTAALRAAG